MYGCRNLMSWGTNNGTEQGYWSAQIFHDLDLGSSPLQQIFTGYALLSFHGCPQRFITMFTFTVCSRRNPGMGVPTASPFRMANYFEPLCQRSQSPRDNQPVFAWQRGDNLGVQKDVVVLQKISFWRIPVQMGHQAERSFRTQALIMTAQHRSVRQ